MKVIVLPFGSFMFILLFLLIYFDFLVGGITQLDKHILVNQLTRLQFVLITIRNLLLDIIAFPPLSLPLSRISLATLLFSVISPFPVSLSRFSSVSLSLLLYTNTKTQMYILKLRLMLHCSMMRLEADFILLEYFDIHFSSFSSYNFFLREIIRSYQVFNTYQFDQFEFKSIKERNTLNLRPSVKNERMQSILIISPQSSTNTISR